MLSSRFFLVVASLLIAACSSTTTTNNNGGTGPGGGTADGGTDPGMGTHSTGNGGTCCLNGSFYDCTTKDSFDKCAGFDLDACMKACGEADFRCMDTCFTKLETSTHDPSSCNRAASRDSQCKTTPAPGPGPSTCKGSGTSPINAKCTVDGDCCSSNCTSGFCQGNTLGSGCTVDGDCDSRNCTSGQCQGNSAGSPCTVDGDCSSSNCTDGECQL
ncbi:MAG: hypothetical protein ABIP39_06885 [Polyangiaceae bacterium]